MNLAFLLLIVAVCISSCDRRFYAYASNPTSDMLYIETYPPLDSALWDPSDQEKKDFALSRRVVGNHAGARYYVRNSERILLWTGIGISEGTLRFTPYDSIKLFYSHDTIVLSSKEAIFRYLKHDYRTMYSLRPDTPPARSTR